MYTQRHTHACKPPHLLYEEHHPSKSESIPWCHCVRRLFMWAYKPHLLLCWSKRGTRPESVNSEKGNIKAEREEERELEQRERADTSEPQESLPAHCLVSREMNTFTVSYSLSNRYIEFIPCNVRQIIYYYFFLPPSPPLVALTFPYSPSISSLFSPHVPFPSIPHQHRIMKVK